jgi:ABC-type uncharacterized transport system fused permease/ATPase subunit
MAELTGWPTTHPIVPPSNTSASPESPVLVPVRGSRRPSSAAGRLRDILLDSLGRETSDDELRAVLAEVGLAEAVAREGGLGADRDWAAILSLGELQALTFARLLPASPPFAFLDNAVRSTT